MKIKFLKNNKLDKRIALALSLLLFCSFANTAYYLLSNNLPIAYNGIPNICKIIVIIFTLYAVPSILNRFSNLHIFIIIIAVFVVVLNNIFFQQNYQFSNTAFDFFTVCLPAILLFISIKDFDICLKYMQITSIIILICANIIFIFYILNKSVNITYSTGFAYSILIPFLLVFTTLKKNTLIYTTPIILVALIALLSFGSRGPLICVIIFAFLYILKRNTLKKRTFSIFFIFFIILLFIVFYNNLLNIIYQFLLTYDIHSRTLNLLLFDVTHSSGRDQFYIAIFNALKENPFVVRGINADYNLLGIYSHNIFLEVFYEMGIIFGSLFLFIVCYFAYQTIKRKIDTDEKIINLLFFSSSFIPLLFSSSLWTNYAFWSWLLLSYKLQKIRKI